MKRRSALKHIGTGISAGLVLPAWLTSCKEEEPKPSIAYKGTVAIVGAGAAGLYAADYLLTQGIKVVVFEASDRIGGRVRSLRPLEKPSPGLTITSSTKLSNDFPLELGADRIQGTDSSWAKFIQQRDIATVALGGEEHDRYILEGALINHAAALQQNDFNAAKNFANNVAAYAGGNITVQQAIQNGGIAPRMDPVLNGWIGNKYGTSNDRLSILGLAEGLRKRERNTIESVLRSNPMADVLMSVFNKAVEQTQLNTIIQNINYEGEQVTLTGVKAGEPFTTVVDKVIVTVPVSVLKGGDVTFTPALPGPKISALSHMDMDPAIRVLLDFRKNFWETAADPALRFVYGGIEASEYFNAGVGRSEMARTLSVTVSGEKAAALSSLNEGIIPVLLQELDQVYAGQASENVRINEHETKIAVIQDWGKEPFIKGGIAYLKPGGTHADREALAATINNSVFFAGEATDVNGESGTVNGALLSAERAAKEIMTLIVA